MAITFEEEEQHAPIGTFFAIFLLLAVVGVGGYFGIRYLLSIQQAVVPAPSSAIELNKGILSDPRLDSLELLPVVVMDPSEPIGRDSPFQIPPAAVASPKPQANLSKSGPKQAATPATVTPESDNQGNN